VSYQVQRLGFDGQRRRWFDVDEPLVNRGDAIKRASLRQWGNGAEHRVIDGDQVVWPEAES
jgi:hypothetical protein